MGNKGNKGTRPAQTQDTLPEPKHADTAGYPVLSLRHLRNGYGVEELSDQQRSEFLIKWAKRSQYTWAQLVTHPKHGLGFEFMPEKQIKKNAPENLAQDKYMVVRHQGNQPVVGFKAGDIFYALWIEATYGDIYDH